MINPLQIAYKHLFTKIKTKDGSLLYFEYDRHPLQYILLTG